MSENPARPARRPRASHAVFLWLAVAVLAVVVLAGRHEVSQAAPIKVDIQYLHVTNEGATAKAWYDGAPSPGIPVQDALDLFAKQGFKVAEVTQSLRSQEDPTAFVILLQRVN